MGRRIVKIRIFYVGESMNPSPLERAVVGMILFGEHPVLEKLRSQWEAASVHSRELTGVGFYANLEVPMSVQSLSSKNRFAFGDVLVDFPELTAPVGSVLFVDEGRLSVLELYTHGEPWPEDDSRFALRYVREPRTFETLNSLVP
jgi:hypothetical protein